MADPRTTIDVRGLGKVYPGGVEAVAGVSFSVGAGEVFGLLGPNGAGKSTTIGMLTGTVAPTSGSARLAGFDVSTEPLAARRVSSVLFQEPVVDRPLTGRRNLEIHARLWALDPAETRARVGEIVDAFALDALADRPVAGYSGGERRRLEIARALIARPAVLFLDEPTVGLDPRIRVELLDAIAKLRDRSDMTILLTTHYLDEAERLADRIAIMRSGRIVALGTPEELVAGLGDRILEMRIRGEAGAAMRTLRRDGVIDADAFSIGSTLLAPAGGRAADEVRGATAAAGLDVLSAVIRPTTLDDVYLSLTGDDRTSEAA